MSSQTFAVGGLAVITLFMIIALATVGLNASAPKGQVAETAAAQSIG